MIGSSIAHGGCASSKKGGKCGDDDRTRSGQPSAASFSFFPSNESSTDSKVVWLCRRIWIRFNPDGGGVDLEDKLEVLRDTIEEQLNVIDNEENEELVSIIKLFY